MLRTWVKSCHCSPPGDTDGEDAPRTTGTITYHRCSEMTRRLHGFKPASSRFFFFFFHSLPVNLPIHHTQLSICISNPEGVKVPQFVISDKRQTVYQCLILSCSKLWGAWTGATPSTRSSVMNSRFKRHMTEVDKQNK